MFKVLALIAVLAISAASAQGPEESAAAAEPYSYGYQTDSHGATEQRDPSGNTTGYYFLSGDDGRARRVDYYADATGFHARVQSNEVGVKSSYPADVEVQASEPNQEQYYQAQRYQTQTVQQQVQQAPPPPQQQQRFFSQQVTVQPPVRTTTQYVQQPYAVGYNPGSYYGYNTAYTTGAPAYGYGVANQAYGVGSGNAYGGYGQQYTSYNNHLPSQYYRSVQSVQPSNYAVNTGGVVGTRYVSTTSTAPAQSSGSSYRSFSSSSGYQPAGVNYQQVVGGAQPAGQVSYQAGAVPATSSYSRGSSNYIVLQKRDSAAAAVAATAENKQ